MEVVRAMCTHHGAPRRANLVRSVRGGPTNPQPPHSSLGLQPGVVCDQHGRQWVVHPDIWTSAAWTDGVRLAWGCCQLILRVTASPGMAELPTRLCPLEQDAALQAGAVKAIVVVARSGSLAGRDSAAAAMAELSAANSRAALTALKKEKAAGALVGLE